MFDSVTVMEQSSHASRLEEGDHGGVTQPCLLWNTQTCTQNRCKYFSVKGDGKWNKAMYVTLFLSVVGTFSSMVFLEAYCSAEKTINIVNSQNTHFI